ncbi:MAG: phosphoenolpyruvate carboxylase [Salinirussus sp.]
MNLHDRDLGADISQLGDMLGRVIEAEEPTGAYEAVETVRTGSIDYRRGEADSRAVVRDQLGENSEAVNTAIARAFTTYFMLTNLAEERERVRSLRRRSQRGTLDDSIQAGVERLLDRGADAAAIESVLSDVLIEPTFTAHPTEAQRKTVKTKLRRMSTLLESLDQRSQTDAEEAAVLAELETELLSLWDTSYVRDRRPEPTDEARNVQWYLENTMFDVIADSYRTVERTVDEALEETIDVPKLFEYRSWAGSDRDGNPFVTPAVTDETLDRQREVVIERYQDRLETLSTVLSHHDTRVETTRAFEVGLAEDRDRFEGFAGVVSDRYPDEPYRQKLAHMWERLDRVGSIRGGEYDDPAEFVADLTEIAESLRSHDHGRLARIHVQPLVRQASTFGFSLASLDLRDHQQNHTRAVTEALASEGVDYESMDESERTETLTAGITEDEPVIDVESALASEEFSETTRRVLERFLALTEWQDEYGEQAIDTYCISMCEEPSHVLEVLFLADQVDVVDLPGHAGLDIVPLLETKYALSGARRIMGTLFENRAYSQALTARDDTQEVMIGYSDSNKENGFFAANWALYTNQRRLAEICSDYGIDLRLFHGRGGSISRGGGPMNEAMLALPRETVTGEIKFTEQGEAISEKYANPAIAQRELEQMLNAQMRARYDALQGSSGDHPEEWIEAMEAMSSAARAEYRDLLDTEGFVEYYEQATPISVIEDLNMGSRPASRTGERTVADLRAIPWVFSWTQSRCILPGWYTIGTGISAYLDDGGEIDTLREMYREWPFFETTIDRAALALGRTDMEIATEYANLADRELRERFFPRIEAEYERAADHVLSITGREHLIDRGWLRESLDRRNPYVDPLNLLQVQLLETDAEERSHQQIQTLRLTVKGIAAGMKNTG